MADTSHARSSLIRQFAAAGGDPNKQFPVRSLSQLRGVVLARVVAFGAWWLASLRGGWTGLWEWIYTSSPAQRRLIAHSIGVSWIYIWVRAALFVYQVR